MRYPAIELYYPPACQEAEFNFHDELNFRLECIQRPLLHREYPYRDRDQYGKVIDAEGNESISYILQKRFGHERTGLATSGEFAGSIVCFWRPTQLSHFSDDPFIARVHDYYKTPPANQTQQVWLALRPLVESNFDTDFKETLRSRGINRHGKVSYTDFIVIALNKLGIEVNEPALRRNMQTYSLSVSTSRYL